MFIIRQLAGMLSWLLLGKKPGPKLVQQNLRLRHCNGLVLIAEKRSRILTLDLLRGYLLFVILIDHMGFFPSVFEVFTGRGEMWASAAEGFFMISGLLVGYVYGPRMVKNALSATQKIWKRAFLLYTLTVLLTFLFVWWGNMSDVAHVKEGLWTQPNIGEFLWKTLTLQYYYGWADFLPYYAIFMAWAPLALYAITRGKAWVVLAISAACWLARGSSFEMSWQLLFMGAMVVGWYLPAIEARVRALSPPMQKRLRVGLYSLAGMLLLASVLTIRVAEFAVHEFASFTTLPGALQHLLIWLDDMRLFMTPLIVKWTLEPVRILTAATWFAALYVWMRQRESWLHTKTRGALKLFGERSLVVYVIHAVAIFALLLMVPGDHGFVLNSIMTVAVLAIVYVTVRVQARLARAAQQRKAATQASPRLRLTNEETA